MEIYVFKQDNSNYLNDICTRLTPGVLLPPDHRHEFKILIPITLLDMTTITVIDHGMSLSVLYDLTH